MDLAEGALRDPRNFSLTKNLRLVKKIPAPGKPPPVGRNMKIYENPIIGPYISHICRDLVKFTRFSSINVLDLAEGALRDPRKIFLTSNPRLVKKISAPANSQLI